jgi:ATP-dependent helicase/nuclease subunit A
MPVTYTNEQQTAIRARDGNILVSAAAGSGKTAVLTERIIEYIAGGEADIDELLVVTFTEAAAAEMRERIASGIESRLSAEPCHVHLAKQAALLPSADISTIHAFCRKLLKQHFQQAGLDPSFKVGDETELSMIKSRVMDELFEEEYAKENNAAFLDLADAFGGRALDVRLDDLIRDVHTFIQNEPFPAQAAQSYASAYDDGFESLDKLPWTKIAREELAMGLEAALEGVGAARALCLLPEGPSAYLPALDADEETLTALLHGMDRPFETLSRDFKAVAWARLPAQRLSDGIDPHVKERVTEIRIKEIKNRVNNLTESVFFAPPEKMRGDLLRLRNRVRALMDLVLRFGQKYAEEKTARNILDFNDLEHYAVKLLTGSAAPSFAYKEILIDEYQDANAVQELILTAVAGRNRLFMVGDAKQSIYRFRRANPRLFIEKMNDPSLARRIDLSQNFRSRGEVLDTVNFFFKRLMSPEVGEVGYDRQAMLHPGALFPAGTGYATSLELAVNTDEDELSSIEQEAAVIARCIRERVNRQLVWDASSQAQRPCRLSDMVILVRSVSSVAKDFTEALKNNGIDGAADLQTGFFETPEIKTALAFLRVVDNPRQDIELITALYSPVYAFSADELLAVREVLPEGDFYDALVAFDSQNKSEKTARFLSDLNKWRRDAAHMPVSRLLGTVYDDTNYPAHAGGMPGGDIRQGNLRLLLERAMQFEETGLTGLFHFVRFIGELHTAGGAGGFRTAQSAALHENRVRIMTIHKAKGLEFPIVFVSLLGRRFNQEDERENVILHSKYGIGLHYTDVAARTKANTLARYSLSRLVRRERLSEELRVLYVAMTRAKEQLILTGCVRDFEKKQMRWAFVGEAAEGLLPLYYRRECGTYLDWLMPCLYGKGGLPPFVSLRVGKASQGDDDTGINYFNLTAHEPENACPQGFPLHKNPYGHPVNLPSKLSISEIKRLFASDITPDSTALYDTPSDNYDYPAFIREGAPDARRMGTALHTVAEHWDIHTHRDEASVGQLVAALEERNLLTAEEAAAVDIKKILAFMGSPLAERMRAAKTLQREVPFVMDMPDFKGHGERVLVHGIIDCYFEEAGKIVLVDYKSGAVRGDADAWAIQKSRRGINGFGGGGGYNLFVRIGARGYVKDLIYYFPYRLPFAGYRTPLRRIPRYIAARRQPLPQSAQSCGWYAPASPPRAIHPAAR